MTIEEKILEKLEKMDREISKMDRDISEIKDYIPTTDVVTNEKYCEIRTKAGAKITVRGLREWFDKGCPRVDSRHVSISAVNKWAEDNNTKQKLPKPKP